MPSLSLLSTIYVSISVASAQLTGSQRTFILNAHNEFRANVANGNQQGRSSKYPGASNLGDLRWDNTLAELAQNYAEECGPAAHEAESVRSNKYKKIYNRNPNAARFVYKYDGVGENIAGNCPYNKGVIRFADHEARWWDYANSWGRSVCKKGATNSNNPICSHLTQVIWADTKYVGCGWSKCGNNGKLVCNYYPSGNVVKQYPYVCNTPGRNGCPSKLTGMCCDCSTLDASIKVPPSKATCNTACERQVADKDSWCGQEKNSWDQTCRNIANNLCKAANSLENSCDFEDTPICVDGLSLFGDEADGETKQFVVHEASECNENGWMLYHHAASAFANYYLKYFEEVRNGTMSGWKITEQLLEYNANVSWWAEESTIAICYENDLQACIENVWMNNDESISAYECKNEGAAQTQSGSSAPVIAVSLIALLLIAAALGVGFYCCVYRKNKAYGKNVSVANDEKIGMRTDDGMELKHETMNGTQTIDVET